MIGETIVIGFGHRAQCGKDTAVSAILAAFPDAGARRYAVGDLIREEVRAAAFDRWVQDGCNVTDACTLPRPCNEVQAYIHLCAWAGVVFDYTKDTNHQRALLQWWGAYRRDQTANYWVHKLRCLIVQDEPKYALISDMRMWNERGMCDYIVRCDRPDFEIGVGANDITETELAKLPDAAWTVIISATEAYPVEHQAINFFAMALGGRYNSSKRNWPEDFDDENGMYDNTCCVCKELFRGNKRRLICKRCATSEVVR